MSEAREFSPAPPASEDRAAPRADGGDIFNDPVFLKYLKIAVVVMALILILGFIGIIARIFYVSSRVPAQPPAVARTGADPTSKAGAPAAAGAALIERLALELPRSASVRSVALSGDRLAVHYEMTDAPSGRPGVAIVDLVTGRTLSRIEIMPEPERR